MKKVYEMNVKEQLEELLKLVESAKDVCNAMPEFYKPADDAFIALKDVIEIAEDALFELEKEEV